MDKVNIVRCMCCGTKVDAIHTGYIGHEFVCALCLAAFHDNWAAKQSKYMQAVGGAKKTRACVRCGANRGRGIHSWYDMPYGSICAPCHRHIHLECTKAMNEKNCCICHEYVTPGTRRNIPYWLPFVPGQVVCYHCWLKHVKESQEDAASTKYGVDTPAEFPPMAGYASKPVQEATINTIKKRMPVCAWENLSSNGFTKYTTILHDDGYLSCDCPGWTQRSVRECKHTKKILQNGWASKILGGEGTPEYYGAVSRGSTISSKLGQALNEVDAEQKPAPSVPGGRALHVEEEE